MGNEYARMTGIADEGGESIERQVENHKALGWETIELRNVEKTNICEMDDRRFDKVRGAMEKAGMRAAGFSSAIANWARPITGEFSRDREDLIRAIPRMRLLNTKFIRIMSYPNDGLEEKAWKDEAFSRITELTRIAGGEGIVLLLENCDGWASTSPRALKEMLSHINSPALQAVFDTGNPVSHGGDSQSVWDFYHAALPWLVHFHIKDCEAQKDGEKAVHTYPGKGDCCVPEIMKDLIGRGYGGMFSIEPHILAQVHLAGDSPENTDPQKMYLEYGKQANRLLDAAMGR
ncbi:MAG: sugar phosphate isomerase/epimerase [Treponema sp.]|jgi:sugar phosphate isomerase/epimerase|nr:sugar phosphate isomerase/epimerase [Treponema sp.]